MDESPESDDADFVDWETEPFSTAQADAVRHVLAQIAGIKGGDPKSRARIDHWWQAIHEAALAAEAHFNIDKVDKELRRPSNVRAVLAAFAPVAGCHLTDRCDPVILLTLVYAAGKLRYIDVSEQTLYTVGQHLEALSNLSLREIRACRKFAIDDRYLHAAVGRPSNFVVVSYVNSLRKVHLEATGRDLSVTRDVYSGNLKGQGLEFLRSCFKPKIFHGPHGERSVEGLDDLLRISKKGRRVRNKSI